MKLIKMLAKEFAKAAYDPMENRELEVDPLRVEGFEAGFRKAREMAANQVRMEPHMPPEANCLEYRIERLGEDEANAGP